MTPKAGIYRITNIVNKKIYIGSSAQKLGLNGRFVRHKSSLKNNKHKNQYLQNSWNKYGEESFIFEVILYCSPDKCLFFEQKCLDTYKPWIRDNGYNICKIAGSWAGNKHTEEAKEKTRVAKLGSKNPMFGKFGAGHPMFEKHHTKECKKVMSLAKDSVKRSIERIDIKTGEVREYESFIAATLEGFNIGSLWRVCNGKRKTYKGFYWKYLNGR